MAADEPQTLVEPMGVDPAVVGGELHQHGTVRLGARDRRTHQPFADLAAASRGPDAHTLDLRPGGAEPADPVDQGELQATDHGTF